MQCTRLNGNSRLLPTYTSMRTDRATRTVAITGSDGNGKTTPARLASGRLQAADCDAQYVHTLCYLSNAWPSFK